MDTTTIKEDTTFLIDSKLYEFCEAAEVMWNFTSPIQRWRAYKMIPKLVWKNKKCGICNRFVPSVMYCDLCEKLICMECEPDQKSCFLKSHTLISAVHKYTGKSVRASYMQIVHNIPYWDSR
jgi:hypothetical protein